MRFLKTAGAAAIALLIPALTFAATDTLPPLSARISASMDDVRPLEPVTVQFSVENISAREILLPSNFFSPADPGKTGMFFFVTGPGGLSLDSHCPAAARDGATALIPLLPGEYHGRKDVRLNECFTMNTAGKYTVRVVFTSADAPDGAWEGTLKSPAVTVTILESPALKSASEASVVIADWQMNYSVSEGRVYKRKLISIGLPAAVAIARALDSSTDYSFASDLIDVLGSLPCREAGDSLIDFIDKAPNRNFKSNMPAGFNPGTVLVGEVFQSLQEMTREDLALYKKVHRGTDTADLWKWWWQKNRDIFPIAVPDEF